MSPRKKSNNSTSSKPTSAERIAKKPATNQREQSLVDELDKRKQPSKVTSSKILSSVRTSMLYIKDMGNPYYTKWLYPAMVALEKKIKADIEQRNGKDKVDDEEHDPIDRHCPKCGADIKWTPIRSELKRNEKGKLKWRLKDEFQVTRGDLKCVFIDAYFHIPFCLGYCLEAKFRKSTKIPKQQEKRHYPCVSCNEENPCTFKTLHELRLHAWYYHYKDAGRQHVDKESAVFKSLEAGPYYGKADTPVPALKAAGYVKDFKGSSMVTTKFEAAMKLGQDLAEQYDHWTFDQWMEFVDQEFKKVPLGHNSRKAFQRRPGRYQTMMGPNALWKRSMDEYIPKNKQAVRGPDFTGWSKERIASFHGRLEAYWEDVCRRLESLSLTAVFGVEFAACVRLYEACKRAGLENLEEPPGAGMDPTADNATISITTSTVSSGNATISTTASTVSSGNATISTTTSTVSSGNATISTTASTASSSNARSSNKSLHKRELALRAVGLVRNTQKRDGEMDSMAASLVISNASNGAHRSRSGRIINPAKRLIAETTDGTPKKKQKKGEKMDSTNTGLEGEEFENDHDEDNNDPEDDE